MDRRFDKVISDLETTAMIASVVILVLTGAAFIQGNDGQKIFVVVFVMGAVLNGILAWCNYIKEKKTAGLLMGILAVLYLGIGIFTFLHMGGA